MKKWIGLALAFCFTLTLAGAALAATQFVTIGTGGVTGVYYPTGGAITKIINKKRSEYGIRATVESTGGSVFNVNAIAAGDLEMGVVQSDIQYQAYNGKGEWDGKPVTKLRAMFAIHPEAVTILAATDKNINSVADLKGKIVNIGVPGSGQRVNSVDLFEAAGIDVDKELQAEGIKPAESASLLQDGRIDAFFYTVGHPNGSIKECDVYVSRNGDDWGEPVWQGRFTPDAGVKRVELSQPVRGRFLRFVARSGHANGPWASAAEVEILVE